VQRHGVPACENGKDGDGKSSVRQAGQSNPRRNQGCAWRRFVSVSGSPAPRIDCPAQRHVRGSPEEAGASPTVGTDQRPGDVPVNSPRPPSTAKLEVDKPGLRTIAKRAKVVDCPSHLTGNKSHRICLTRRLRPVIELRKPSSLKISAMRLCRAFFLEQGRHIKSIQACRLPLPVTRNYQGCLIILG